MPSFDAERYSRHVFFAGIGEEGQARICRSTALIIGCGALGSAQAEMLARSGVGVLKLVDRDFVEWSNLQRQTLFSEEDARQSLPKAVALESALKRINSSCRIQAEVEDFNSSNAEQFVEGADVVLDGTDNFQARYLINDCSVKLNTPWIYGACVAATGATASFLPGETLCLRCLFPKAPLPGEGPTCDTAGIVTSVPKWVASIQVTEALKIVSGARLQVRRALLTFDAWSNRFQEVRYSDADPDCACCGRRKFEFLQGREETTATMLCGRDSVQIVPRQKQRLDLNLLEQRLRSLGPVRVSNYLLRFGISPHELTVFPDGRAIVKGTSDPGTAKTLYARYIGD
ncbi:MAG TPA: ThiF family adenylyltransferase [Acidobacteriota bacterium]|jgi:adenylyltransferase/sulfurtransferase